VNNFAGAEIMAVNNSQFSTMDHGGHAWPGRRMACPKRTTFKPRVSLRTRRLDFDECSETFASEISRLTNHYKAFDGSRPACPLS
jgi:hypothetical protein